jgi:hypothetical protein
VRGPEVAWGTIWSASPFITSTGTVIFFRSSVQSSWMNAETQSYWPFAPPIMPWRHQFAMTAAEGVMPGWSKF